jgi:DNA primase
MQSTPEKIQIIKDLSLLRLIVSEKVSLNADNDFGLCPFHDESTPSFHIYLAKSGRARYHCFGCLVDGDIFNFMEAIYHLKFELAYMRLKTILKTGGVSPISSFVSPGPEPEYLEKDQKIQTQSPLLDPNYCFLNCKNYQDLKTDYEILLEENHELREKLNIDNFQPSNETPYQREEE